MKALKHRHLVAIGLVYAVATVGATAVILAFMPWVKDLIIPVLVRYSETLVLLTQLGGAIFCGLMVIKLVHYFLGDDD